MMIQKKENNGGDPYKDYLKQKFDSLLDKVGEGYGPSLQDELVRRLELTIDHFHTEVTELIQTLKTQSNTRENSLKKMLEKDTTSDDISETIQPDPEVSDWEKRLEAREKNKKKGPSPKIKSDEKPKKGLFGRKKS